MWQLCRCLPLVVRYHRHHRRLRRSWQPEGRRGIQRQRIKVFLSKMDWFREIKMVKKKCRIWEITGNKIRICLNRIIRDKFIEIWRKNHRLVFKTFKSLRLHHPPIKLYLFLKPNLSLTQNHAQPNQTLIPLFLPANRHQNKLNQHQSPIIFQ